MPVERRGQAIRVMINLVNWQQEEPTGCGGGRQLSMDGTSRVTGDSHARFCERLGVRFPGPTRRCWVTGIPTATMADLDDDYITKMEDVLELYERPYDQEQPVGCLDEKPIALHADVRPASPAAPGREARRDNEYERCGTANVFCAVEPKAGRHFTFATPDRSGFEFAQVAVSLALAYPDAKTIHLVMDNLNIHRRKALADAFGAEMAAEVWDRFTVHYTPTHGSWLNQAEIEIGMFSRQCLGKRRLPSLKILKSETKAWNRRINRDRVKIAWKFDRKAARNKFGYTRKLFKRSKTKNSRFILK